MDDDHDNISVGQCSIEPDVESGGSVFKAMAQLEELTQHKNQDSWTENQEHLLNTWAEKAASYRWMHEHSIEYFRFLSDLLTYPIIFVSSILGMSGFAMISHEKPTMFEIQISYTIAGLNVLVAFLSSLQKLKRYSESAESHKISSCGYVKFYREITMELVLDRINRTYSVDFCRDAKIQYDKLASDSPGIPSHIVKLYYKKFPEFITKTNELYDF